jgi:chemotaxis response regulator CheB
MKNIRVLVANRPRLMRELVLATIADQPDIEIVGEIQDESEIENAIKSTEPDFLIVALEKSNRLPAVCDFVLQNHPRMKVIAISPNRNSSIFYWASLQIKSSQIEASEDGVLGALRGVRAEAGEVQ